MARAPLEARLWLLQRASGTVLAVCVAVHLVTMILAVRGGLTAAEILARTRGSMAWLCFYGVFVAAVAFHAPLGLRSIVGEWTPWRGRSLDMMLMVFAFVLLVAGWRAIGGLFA